MQGMHLWRWLRCKDVQASALESAARRPAMLADSQWAALGARLTTLERHLQVDMPQQHAACLPGIEVPPVLPRFEARLLSVSLAGASAESNACCACCSRQQVPAAELPSVTESGLCVAGLGPKWLHNPCRRPGPCDAAGRGCGGADGSPERPPGTAELAGDPRSHGLRCGLAAWLESLVTTVPALSGAPI